MVMIQYFTGRINDVVDVDDLPDMNRMLYKFSHGLTIVDNEWLCCCKKFPTAHIILARDEKTRGEKGFAKDFGKIVGMTFMNFSIKCAGIYGFVDDVVVLEEYRGKQYGIAGNLMIQVDNLASRFSAKHVDLTCSRKPERDPAHRLYRKHGYVERNAIPYRKRYAK
jgi:GNAT superfamily N-acetyltransferase